MIFRLAFQFVCVVSMVGFGVGTSFLHAWEPTESSNPLKSGDRVAFIGAGFIERMQQYDWLEAMLTVSLPETKFRNVGWSGDTVFGDARAVFGSREDGFARLLRDIDQANPTVSILCYGENECWDGESGLAAFASNYKKLVEHLVSKNSKVIAVLPRLREAVPSLPGTPTENYNSNLKQYNNATRKLAQELGFPLIDLESFALGENLTTDGVYWTEDGYYRAAVEICHQLNISESAPKLSIHWKSNTVSMEGTGGQISLKMSGGKAMVDLKWNQLPVASRGKLAVSETIDGKSVLKTVEAKSLEEQIDELRRRINLKNSWFFHRYRPQNETYLFLFRKHEQGNNAAELEEIEPKISNYESDIARSAKMSTVSIVLTNPAP